MILQVVRARVVPSLLWRTPIVVLIFCLLTACPEDVSVPLAQDATADSLVFTVSNYSQTAAHGFISTFDVVRRTWRDGRSESEWMWRIAGRGRLATIRYGELPPGFEELLSPQDLVPGRYTANAGGSGVDFDIGVDGTVADPADLDDRFAPAGLVSSEVETFLEELNKALKRRDSVAVAGFVHYPLFVGGHPGVRIDGPQDLQNYFRQLFSPQMIESLAEVDVSEVSANYNGASPRGAGITIGADCTGIETPRCPPEIVAVYNR